MYSLLNIISYWLLNDFVNFILNRYFNSSDYWNRFFDHFGGGIKSHSFHINGLFSDLFNGNFNDLLNGYRHLNNMLNFFLNDVVNEDRSFNQMFNRNLNFLFYHNLIWYWFFNDVFDVNWLFYNDFDIFVDGHFNRHLNFLFDDFFNWNRSFNNLINEFFYYDFLGYLNDFLNWFSDFFLDNIVNIDWFFYDFILMNVFNFST